MIHKVLITNRVPEDVTHPVDGLAEVRMGGEQYVPMSREQLLETLSDVSGLINQGEVEVDQEIIEAAPQLKIVANISIGTNNLDLESLSNRGIWATNAPGYFSSPVVEHVVAGMIAISRRLPETDAFVRRGAWHHFEPGRWDGQSLEGKILGIIGYGQIGKKLARVAESLGMQVHWHDRGDSRDSLTRLLGKSNVVSIHVPLTDETHNMIGPREIGQMQPHAIFINTSRGGVVDQAALIDALSTKKLAGAVLDVFDREPHVPEALRSMDNVLLTPHIAGGTVESRREARLCAFRNVAAVLRGKRPPNALNYVDSNHEFTQR